MSASPQKVKRFAEVSIAVMLVLGIVTLALAPFTGHYRGFYLSIFLGAIIVVASVVYLPIVHMKKAEDLRGVGVPAIQSLWVSTSMGLGYVVTALAPYFNINFSTAVALFVVGWILLIYGCYALLRISKESKVPLSV
jgi:cobalamin synthase